jgi:hypothetical protein
VFLQAAPVVGHGEMQVFGPGAGAVVDAQHADRVTALLMPTACPHGLPAPFEKKLVREGRSIGTDAEAFCRDGSIAGNDTARRRARR